MSECLCLILLLLHQICVSRPESFQVLGPSEPIVASAGEDIVLPCYLKPSISAEEMRVEWFRIPSTGSAVHLYQEGKIRNEDQIPSYRGRTALFLEDLKRGDASLRLIGVRASDEGRYKCFIQFMLSDDDVSVQVKVRGTEPVISMEVPHRAGWVSLLCESKGWDIQPDLLWLDSEGHSLPAGATKIHRDSEDLYTVRRKIIIQDRDTNTVTCRVHLLDRKLEKDTEFNITAEMFPVPRWKASLPVFLPLAAAALIGCAVLTHRYRERDKFRRARQELKADLKKKFECIFEDLAQQDHPTLLNEIYTELYITEGGGGGVNNEHEVRQIEAASKRQTTQETAILCNDIFKPLPGQNKPIRTVLTKGIAGIGKMVSVQKFILDWVEGKANQDVYFIFPLPFRDLNKMESKISLMQLLQHFFPQMKHIKMIKHDKIKSLFIFDGLDECKLPLDFQNSEICSDVTESTSVDVLLTNLIKGNLFPSALLWITSQQAAANQIPPEYIHQVTEIRGFSDPQKEAYFRKRIRDQILASRIISHIKSSRSLYIMCHIPVFSQISAAVLERRFGEAVSGKLPKTLTEIYTHFLLIQTNVKNQKDHGIYETNPETSTSDTEMILKLGKLAFLQLEKGNLILYEEDLKESDIDVCEALVFSGVCREIVKEEPGLNQEKAYSFVHLSIQEYLAALFVFLSCVNENRNAFRPEESRPEGDRIQLFELHRSAVDQALQSKNGHLDLFLRFLLGLSLESNQALLGGLLSQTGSRSQSIWETVQYIKQKIRDESSAEKTINLLHCLNEVNDNSLVHEIEASMRPGRYCDEELEPEQCSAVAFVLLMSEEVLDVFDLKTYRTSAAGHQRLVPAVRNCKNALLDSANLTEESCEIVASVLQASNSSLRELDVSFNNLGDSGVKLLCAGLMSPNCKLQILRLGWCNLTEGCCDNLASVLRSPHSELRDLELRDNELQDSGVRALSAGLEDPHCKLQRLGLSGCRVTERGCDSLASALHSNPSHLKELDLSYNHPGDSGVKALSAAKLATLKLLVDHGGEIRNKPGPRKYGCQLTLDPNTAHRSLSLSEGDRKASCGKMQSYPYHPDRFDFWEQVLCRENLSDRCYWEAEWYKAKNGLVFIAVTNKGIRRKGGANNSVCGDNKYSWSLQCTGHSYNVSHNNKHIYIPALPSPYRRAGESQLDTGVRVYRVGVCLDRPAGTLSFYSISDSDTLTLLHTYHTSFTRDQPLCAAFGLYEYNASVYLCQLE